MTAAERQQIAAAKADARRYELAAMEARIDRAITEAKIVTLEKAEARRQRTLIDQAVQRLIENGAIHAGDHCGQFRMLEQLARDPTLCSLALQKKVFRARPAVRP